jgi:hypothetical protein
VGRQPCTLEAGRDGDLLTVRSGKISRLKIVITEMPNFGG